MSGFGFAGATDGIEILGRAGDGIGGTTGAGRFTEGGTIGAGDFFRERVLPVGRFWAPQQPVLPSNLLRLCLPLFCGFGFRRFLAFHIFRRFNDFLRFRGFSLRFRLFCLRRRVCSGFGGFSHCGKVVCNGLGVDWGYCVGRSLYFKTVLVLAPVDKINQLFARYIKLFANAWILILIDAFCF